MSYWGPLQGEEALAWALGGGRQLHRMISRTAALEAEVLQCPAGSGCALGPWSSLQ